MGEVGWGGKVDAMERGEETNEPYFFDGREEIAEAPIIRHLPPLLPPHTNSTVDLF